LYQIRELGVSLRYNIVDVSRETSALITFLHIEGKAMRLVEQNLIRKSDSRCAAIDRAAFAPKNLYNQAN